MGSSTSIRDEGRMSRRALVIRIGALGDMVLTRRLTWSLALAGYRTTLFAPARNAGLLVADPWIEGLIDSETAASADAFRGVWPRRADMFDAAVVISRSETLAAAARSIAGRVCVISPDPTRDEVPIALQLAVSASSIAAPWTGVLPRLPVDPPLAAEALRVVLHSGSGAPRKNWPAQKFVALGASLRELGFRVTWTRGPADPEAPAGTREFEVLDLPSLSVLAATLASSRACVGNDSGVTHLAAAVGAPTVAIFGPTSDAVWRPDGPQVRTLRAPSGSLADVSGAEVLSAVLAVIKSPEAALRGAS